MSHELKILAQGSKHTAHSSYRCKIHERREVNILKKTVIAIAMLVMLIGVAGNAHAIPLAIGGSTFGPFGAQSPAFGMPAVATISESIIGMDNNGKIWFQGTLNQWVRYSATGSLVFEYQLINNLGSLAGITIADTTDYDSFTTNVDSDLTGLLPTFIARPAPGNGISFNFWTPPIGGGLAGNSGILWVETNAPTYQLIGTTQVQGTGNTRVSTYAPTVPEPTSVALLGLGLLGFAGKLRKKFMA